MEVELMEDTDDTLNNISRCILIAFANSLDPD